MSRHLLFLIFFLCPLLSLSQQKILLIGTHHKTENERLKEIAPIARVVESFHPGIICVEYPMPADTASVIRKSVVLGSGDKIFQKMDSLRREWKIPAGDMTVKIESLQKDPGLSNDVLKRIELQQLYFLSSDAANADYQGYLVMERLENDSEKNAWCRENFPGYHTMRVTYRGQRYGNNEYYLLVFPLAAKLNISYLYPIDDLSTWNEYEKYYERLEAKDSTDVSKIKYRRHLKNVRQKFKALPKDSNHWVFSNSPQIIHDILYVEGYKIDEGITDEDIKGIQYYWVLRNKMMAQYINTVAQDHPNKDVVVFFGFSHVGPVLEELNKLKKSYRVLTLSEVTK